MTRDDRANPSPGDEPSDPLANPLPTPDQVSGGKWEGTPDGPFWTRVTAASDDTRSTQPLARLEGDPVSRGDAELIRSHLAPDERLLWTGQPAQGLRLGFRWDVGLALTVLFLLAWLGGVATGMWKAVAHDRSLAASLPPALMLLGGLFGLAFVLWLEPRSRHRTTYCLTNWRVLIIRSQLGRNVESLPLALMAKVTLKMNGRGRGTIRFEDWERECGEDDCTPRFWMIDNAQNVYNALLQARDRVVRAKRPEDDLL